MKIPATVMSSDIQVAVQRIPRVHLQKMYNACYEELVEVTRKLVALTHLEITDHSEVVARWLGSEKFLYNYVAALGERAGKVKHERLKHWYDRPYMNRTAKAPLWMRNRNVFKTYIAKLAKFDDLHRMKAQWTRLRNQGLVPDYRGTLESAGFTCEVEYALSLRDNLTYEKAGRYDIERFIRRYFLYRGGALRFFRRNRFVSYVNHHYQYDKKYIQRSYPTSKITWYINDRIRMKSSYEMDRQRRAYREMTTNEIVDDTMDTLGETGITPTFIWSTS